jgi:catechol 2,3-dioxygenase-like lactoylglutathione lyase family enzyme
VARIDGARFGHVNVTGRDWRRLAAFYTEVFGLELVPPERHAPVALEEVLTAGGSRIGDVVTLTTSDGRHVTWCYATDPDANIIELQAWS